MLSVPYRHERQGAPSQGMNTPEQQHSLPPWKLWNSVAVLVRNVPNEVNTFILWQAFRDEGSIRSIDLYEDQSGNRQTKGKIWFRPPPTTNFWKHGRYTINLPDGRRTTILVDLEPKQFDNGIQSPIRPEVRYPEELTLPLRAMQIGARVGKTTIMPMRTIGTEGNEEASLIIDLKHKSLQVNFQLPAIEQWHDPCPTTADAFYQYRLKIPFTQLGQILQTLDNSGCISHLIFLDYPPLYYRHTKNLTFSSFADDNTWREAEAWHRLTSIVHNPEEQSLLPASLQTKSTVIDIGRWNAIRIIYSGNSDQTEKFTMACDILKDYNITLEETDLFTEWNESAEIQPPIWNWIDVPETEVLSRSHSLEELFNPTYIHLQFSVRYQLEVCLSNGYLSEFTMKDDFAIKLSDLGEVRAKKLLEHVATQKRAYYDPMEIFTIPVPKGVTDSKIPPYCCYIRTACITPSTIHYNTPTVDVSNRVIRRFIEHSDRFLRVRFSDEKSRGRINSTADNTMDEVFIRIKRVLANGITIGDRRYEFLAFGNSQLREHAAYFFAPLPDLNTSNIRAWMGDFSDIRNVARNAARLGQCFSTTRAVVGCPVDVVEIDDIQRNGYVFSDGIGMISRFLSQMVMAEHKIETPTGEPPSAFQFRLGGSKGMLALCPQAQRQEVHIRPSQTKFPANCRGLEIIRWSRFAIATMNKQVILVLSCLGVGDRVFHKKLENMMAGLDEAMVNDHQAMYLLNKYVDPNQRSLVVSRMIRNGFRKSKEPFMAAILSLWRAWNLKNLKEKAKIVIDQGACLLGCLDETSTLKGEFFGTKPKDDASYEEKLAALPEIFLQVCRPESRGKYEVIEGVCIVARNPSLHPGDIRVVRAVNVPQLNHLRDVVVFPQTGDRDVPSMCSGGDLDGDDYLIIWDPDLIPNKWFRPPMHYSGNKAQDLDHPVSVDDITTFFVMYMKNDCLGTIAHAHLAWADRLHDGVESDKCISLVQLHSDAVDYNKTGVPATLTRSLRPRMWPHFMEKKGKPPWMIYKSSKILGQIYDAVERISFVPDLGMSFDKRILDCNIKESKELTQFARDLKKEYDSAMRRIMAQYEIKTEFEVWSTLVLSHTSACGDYKFHEDIGAMTSSLQDKFRDHCYTKVGGRYFEHVAPVVVAMYRVTHQEMESALKKHPKENLMADIYAHKLTSNLDDLPFISFPWIFPDILGQIAMGYYELPIEDAAIADPETQQHSMTGRSVSHHQTAPAHTQDTREASDATLSPHPESPRKGEGNVDQFARLRESASRGLFSTAVLSGDDVKPTGLDSARCATNEKGKQPMKENVKIQPVGNDRKECMEIVEEEEDLQLTALDMLTQMLED